MKVFTDRKVYGLRLALAAGASAHFVLKNMSLVLADAIHNAVHASVSGEHALDEIAAFFREGYEQLDKLKALAEVQFKAKRAVLCKFIELDV